jgi:hypothetical protein
MKILRYNFVKILCPKACFDTKKTHRSANKFRPQCAYSSTAVQLNLDCGANFAPVFHLKNAEKHGFSAFF